MSVRTSDPALALGVALTTLALVGACSTSTPGETVPTSGSPESAATKATGQPASPAVHARPAELPGDPVLTWYDAHGRAHLAATIDEVPEEARGRVVISKLGGGARAAMAESVTLADYRDEVPSYSIIDLTALAPEAPDTDALLDHRSIYVYSAPWCGFCKKVKAFLKEKEVPFIERDIERSPEAARELSAKARAAGISARGIPVTDIHGALIVGFDRKALEKRLTEVGVKLAPGP